MQWPDLSRQQDACIVATVSTPWGANMIQTDPRMELATYLELESLRQQSRSMAAPILSVFSGKISDPF